MKKKVFIKLLFLFLCLFSFGNSDAVGAQNSNLRREKTFDVQHYVIRVSFDRATRTVFGDTTVSLKAQKNDFNAFALDAAGLNFESIRLENSDRQLAYRAENEKVFITLDRPYKSDETVSVRFKYSAKPKKGVYFVNAQVEQGEITRPAQIWTQGEPEEARHWFPSYDFPDDKATSEQIITVEKSETAIGNGELVNQSENADGTRIFHYKMPVPHPTYLTSMVIGNYVKIIDNYKSVPLGYYVYPGLEPIVPIAYGRTKEMFRVFEELTKVDFPFNKYDQTIVASFQFGGMENITATTMADTEILFARYDRNLVDDLVSHEIAHSWFGNLVTCKNWSELWLNEGFATFMEAAFREKFYGREDYIRKIREDAEEFFAAETVSRKRPPLFNSAAEPKTLFDEPAFIYEKGGVVLHILRETVGDEAFWKAVNVYLNRHKFENVETADLQKAMEEASGKDLSWFFKQWIFARGYPQIDVQQNYNQASKKLVLTVTQMQKIEPGAPAAFILPLEIQIKTGKGERHEKLEINQRRQTFSIPLESAPQRIIFDEEGKIPLLKVKMPAAAKAKGKPAR